MKTNKFSSKELASQNIKYYRTKRNYTQEKLAAICKFPKTYLSKIENKAQNLTLDQLDLISKALKIPAFMLLLAQEGSIGLRELQTIHAKSEIQEELENIQKSLSSIRKFLSQSWESGELGPNPTNVRPGAISFGNLDFWL